MPLTASRVRALDAVIDEGSYSAAARRLGMSQPAVGQAIHELEKAFNVRLFERRGRHLVPSELCLELAPIVANIRRLEDEALLILDRGEKLETGVLRVGLGNSMPGMAVIGRFQQRFPKIQVLVELGNFADIIGAVQDYRVDVGILPNVPQDGRFFRKVCLSQDVVAIAPAGHPLAERGEAAVAELMQHRLIFRSQGSSTQRVVDRVFKEAGLEPRPAIVLETRDGVYEAVANGLGVGFMWRHGTSRADSVRRVTIGEMATPYDEVVFRRADTANPFVDMFFATSDPIDFA